MKIVTWNVNSIRTRLPRVRALLERHRPDLLCLQETKVEDAAFPAAELAESGYRCETFGQKTYNGVALISREPPAGVERLAEVSIDRDERKTSTGEGKPSDHAPVIVTLQGG